MISMIESHVIVIMCMVWWFKQCVCNCVIKCHIDGTSDITAVFRIRDNNCGGYLLAGS